MSHLGDELIHHGPYTGLDGLNATPEEINELRDELIRLRRKAYNDTGTHDRPPATQAGRPQYLGTCGTTRNGITCGGSVYAQPGSLTGNCRTCTQLHNVADRPPNEPRDPCTCFNPNPATRGRGCPVHPRNLNIECQCIHHASHGNGVARDTSRCRLHAPWAPPTYRPVAASAAHAGRDPRCTCTYRWRNNTWVHERPAPNCPIDHSNQCPYCRHRTTDHTTTIGGTTQCHGGPNACPCAIRPTTAQTHPRQGQRETAVIHDEAHTFRWDTAIARAADQVAQSLITGAGTGQPRGIINNDHTPAAGGTITAADMQGLIDRIPNNQHIRDINGWTMTMDIGDRINWTRNGPTT